MSRPVSAILFTDTAQALFDNRANATVRIWPTAEGYRADELLGREASPPPFLRAHNDILLDERADVLGPIESELCCPLVGLRDEFRRNTHCQHVCHTITSTPTWIGTSTAASATAASATVMSNGDRCVRALGAPGMAGTPEVSRAARIVRWACASRARGGGSLPRDRRGQPGQGRQLTFLHGVERGDALGDAFGHAPQ